MVRYRSQYHRYLQYYYFVLIWKIKESKKSKLDENVIVEDTIEILESFSEKNELSAITAITVICSEMSMQAIISLTKTLSSLASVKMVKDILKEDATNRNINN